MNKPTHSESTEPSGPDSDKKAVSGDSIEQRRAALRRVGQAAAAAGVASPMAALATGTGRKWACNPPKTNKVHATISGCKSVLLSGQAGNQCYGKPCSYYQYSYNIPGGCKYGDGTIKRFKDILTCDSGSKDSLGVVFNPNDSSNGCLFHKRITTLCSRYATSPEAHWAVAYCNSTAYHGAGNFPYDTTEVHGHWRSPTIKGDAYCFYTDYLEGA